jgi:hypothetical protein
VSFLLDTNILSAHLRRPAGLAHRFFQHSGRLYTSGVSLAELYDCLKGEALVILADPQRMIRAGARAVDGWAKENGFTVLFCSGNLALREMYENLRDDPTAKLILVDRTRDKGSGRGHPLSGTWATWTAPNVMPTK